MPELSDRELLEWAAKAMGLTLADPEDSGIPSGGIWIVGRRGYDEVWNPLHDDGDAFRLAAWLGMNVYMSSGVCVAEVIHDGDYAPSTAKEPWKGGAAGRISSARRAIVKVAAELGQAGFVA